MNLNEFLSMLNNVKRNGNQYSAKCPAHEDRHNSLSISEGERGILCHCHAGCGLEDVLAALRLEKHHLMYSDRNPTRQNHPHPASQNAPHPASQQHQQKQKPTAIYNYTDADGTLLYQKLRYEPKRFVQRQPAPNGTPSNSGDGWLYTLKGVERVLYRLPELVDSPEVWLVEGEKDADTLSGYGIVATCAPGGAGNTGIQQATAAGKGAKAAANSNGKWQDSFTKALAGKQVMILPDNDDIGRKFAREVADILCVASTVKIIDIASVEKKYTLREHDDVTDIAEWMENFYGAARGKATLIASLTVLSGDAEVHAPRRPPLKRHDYLNSDLGAADIFAEVHGEDVRYLPQQGSWFIWDGKRWKMDEMERISELGKEVVKEYIMPMIDFIPEGKVREWSRWAQRLQNNHARKCMLETARSRQGISISLDEMDAQPHYINLRNGIYDMKQRTLLPHDRKFMLANMAGAELDEAAQLPRWEEFVLEVMGGDAAMAGFLQRAVGYAITGEPSRDCMFILYGSRTRNGKSTFVSAIQGVLGDYACTANAESLGVQQRSSSGPSSDIARLHRRRFVAVPEPDKSLALDVALVKKLTGRDEIVARYMHRDFFTFKPNFVIFMNTNHLPKAGDGTLFKSGRVHVITFPNYFGGSKGDTTLSATFNTPKARSAILNWCLEGVAMYEADGLNPPEAVRDATEEYAAESDTFGQFLRECIAEQSGENLRAGEVYNCYKAWAFDNGFGQMSIQRMGAEMKDRGYEKKRLTTGNAYLNLRIVPEWIRHLDD